MEKKKLKQGIDLDRQLTELNHQKDLWEKSADIQTMRLNGKDNATFEIDPQHIDFASLKSRALASINKRVKDLEKKFQEL